MTKRVEIIVAVLDRAANKANQTGAAAAIHGHYNTDKKGFSLVAQTGQTATSVASVVSVTQLTPGLLPFINISTNTLAGTITFLKIAADFKAGKEIQLGDVFGLVGNVAGVAASFAILGGAAPLTVGLLTAISFTTTAYSIFDSDLAKTLHKNLGPIFSDLTSKSKTNKTRLVPPNLETALSTGADIDYKSLFTTVDWNPKTGKVTLGQKNIDFFNGDKIKEEPTSGAASGVPDFKVPPPNGPTLTIGIERLGGKIQNPSPSITVGFEDEQDSYCCAGSQQDQYH
jgi:hypothetical protein